MQSLRKLDHSGLLITTGQITGFNSRNCCALTCKTLGHLASHHSLLGIPSSALLLVTATFIHLRLIIKEGAE